MDEADFFGSRFGIPTAAVSESYTSDGTIQSPVPAGLPAIVWTARIH
jgi:hypothetical protein